MSLAVAGVSPDHIHAMGWWHSDTWKQYIHKNLTLLQALLFNGRPVHDPPFGNI